jgi:hypothetical protein
MSTRRSSRTPKPSSRLSDYVNIDEADLDRSPSKSNTPKKRKLSDDEDDDSEEEQAPPKRVRTDHSPQAARMVAQPLQVPNPSFHAIPPPGPMQQMPPYSRMVPPPMPMQMQLPFLQQQMLPQHMPLQMPGMARIPPPGLMQIPGHPVQLPPQMVRPFAAGNHTPGPGEEKQVPTEARAVEQLVRPPMQVPLQPHYALGLSAPMAVAPLLITSVTSDPPPVVNPPADMSPQASSDAVAPPAATSPKVATPPSSTSPAPIGAPLPTAASLQPRQDPEDPDNIWGAADQ